MRVISVESTELFVGTEDQPHQVVAVDMAVTGLPARTFDSRGQSGMSLVRAHCDLARRDPAYTFVLAEVDYLKPYWDSFPEERAFLRQLLRTGRIEIMGGTYNE